MKKIAVFIVNNSKKIIVLTILINLIAAVSIFRARLDVSINSFFNMQDKYTASFNDIAKKYGGIDTIQLVVSSKDVLVSSKNLVELWKYYLKIKSVENVAYAVSFIPNIIPGTYPPIKTNLEMLKKYNKKIKDTVLRRKGTTSLFISADMKSCIIQVRLEEMIDKYKVLEKIKKIEPPVDMQVRFTGTVVVYYTLWHTLLKILFFLPPSVFIILFTVFYFNVRSRRFTLFALLPAVIGALWVFGTIFWAGIALNLILIITPIFVLIMGSADGLHFVIHYLENYSKIKMKPAPKKKSEQEITVMAIAESIGQVGIPMILTSITTMIGFLSLAFSKIVALRYLGIFTALGIGYAGLVSWFFLPALLSHIRVTRDYHRKRLGEHILIWLEWLVKHPILPIVIFSFIVIVSIAVIPRLSVYSDQLLFFKENSAIRKNFAFVEEKFGSSQPVVGEIRLGKKLWDRGELERLYNLERRIERIKGIHRVFSIVDALKGNYEIQVKKSGFPPPMLVKLMLKIFPESESMIKDDSILIFIITKNWNTKAANELMSFVSTQKDLTVTGVPILFARLNELVVETQKQSLIITAIGIFFLLFLLYRNLLYALVSMIPISITVIGIYGLLYVTGFNLNILTVTMSSIAIGVGIDYAIHFVYLIDYFRKRGSVTFVTDAMRSSGIPILANALGIASGMLVMFLSPLRIHFQVGVVMIFAMIVSSVSTLTIIPLFFREKSSSPRGSEKI